MSGSAIRRARIARRVRRGAVKLIEPSSPQAEPVALVGAVVATVVIGVAATHMRTIPYSGVVVPVLVAGLFLRTKALFVVDLALVAVLIRAAVIQGVSPDGDGIRVGQLVVIVITAAFAH